MRGLTELPSGLIANHFILKASCLAAIFVTLKMKHMNDLLKNQSMIAMQEISVRNPGL